MCEKITERTGTSSSNTFGQDLEPSLALSLLYCPISYYSSVHFPLLKNDRAKCHNDMLWQWEITYKIQKSLKCKKCDKRVTVVLKANYKFCIIPSVQILYYNLIELVYWAVLTWLGTRVDELHFLPSCFFLGTPPKAHLKATGAASSCLTAKAWLWCEGVPRTYRSQTVGT